MPFIMTKCYVLIKLRLIFHRLLAKLWPWMAHCALGGKNIGPKCLFNLYSPLFATEKVCL